MIRFLIGLLPSYVWAVVVAGLIGCVGAWVWNYGHNQRNAGRAEVQARWDEAKERQREADAAERIRLDQLRKDAQDAYAKRATRDRASAAAARTELDRLRDALATPADTGTAREPDDASRAERVVIECAAELQTVAEHADATKSTLTELQAWVKGLQLK